MLVAQNSLGPVCPVPLTVRGTLTPASGHPGGPDWAQHPRMKALLRKHFAITIRKYVIGPPAEHPSRRIEHQAPLIASFLI